MTTQQYAKEYSVKFHATAQVNGEESDLLNCIINIGHPTSPNYSRNIENGKGLINKIKTVEPSAKVTLSGNKYIINEILGCDQTPRPPAATKTMNITIPGKLPKDAPTSGTLDVGNGVKATYTAREIQKNI